MPFVRLLELYSQYYFQISSTLVLLNLFQLHLQRRAAIQITVQCTIPQYTPPFGLLRTYVKIIELLNFLESCTVPAGTFVYCIQALMQLFNWVVQFYEKWTINMKQKILAKNALRLLAVAISMPCWSLLSNLCLVSHMLGIFTSP